MTLVAQTPPGVNGNPFYLVIRTVRKYLVKTPGAVVLSFRLLNDFHHRPLHNRQPCGPTPNPHSKAGSMQFHADIQGILQYDIGQVDAQQPETLPAPELTAPVNKDKNSERI